MEVIESSAFTTSHKDQIVDNKSAQPNGQDDAEAILSQIVRASSVLKDFQTLNSSHDIVTSRTLLKTSPDNYSHHLTLSTLAGSNKISKPFVFFCDEVGSLISFYYLGSDVSGHTGIVHGGLLAILLDECMGRACFPLLKGKIGVTAKLELSYRKPIPTESVVVIRALTERVEGRKAWVKASVGDPEFEALFMEANALFIEPKWSESMARVV